MLKRKQTLADLDLEARRFDWSSVAAKSDHEIEAAVRSDADTFMPSQEELDRAVRDRAARIRRAAKPAAE